MIKSRPWRWLWGILPIAALTWMTFLLEHERIQEDLTLRTEQALKTEGVDWASIVFDGRDARLSGVGIEEGASKKALEITDKVRGVRIVEDNTAKAHAYVWKAALRGDKVLLVGFVPDEITRKALIGVVSANFPRFEIVDRMRIARGGPARDVWLGGVSFGLKQLAAMKRGTIFIDDTDISVVGQALNSESYVTLKSAVQAAPSPGMVIVKENVMAPTISPFTWQADFDGKEVIFSGYATGFAARDKLADRARSLFPAATKVTDRLAFGNGSPKDWGRVWNPLLEQLAVMKNGTIAVRDTQIIVTGRTPDDAAARALRAALTSAIPSDYNVTITLATDEEDGRKAETDRLAAEEDARRKAEAERLAAEEDTRRKAEAERLAAEEDTRRKAEAERLAAEEDTQRKAEAERLAAEEDARRKAETERLAAEEDARRKVEAERLAAEEDARRKAEAERLAAEEDARRKAEAERLAAEEDARRKAEAERLAAEEDARRKAEAERLAAEEDARRKAEAERLAAEEDARRKAEADRLTAEKAPPSEQARVEADLCQRSLTSAAREGIIQFETSSAALDQASTPTLQRLAEIAKACPEARIVIEGHTDAEGSPDFNIALSELRARTVAEWLQQAGIDSKRLSAKGFGETKPAVPNTSPRNKAKNRRIEFSVTAN